MGNIDRIDIYVGEVGTAYVDKETALKKLNAAIKNIDDMVDILHAAGGVTGNEDQTFVSHGAKQAVLDALERANAAFGRATRVAQKLQNAITELDTSDPKYELYIALQKELNDNDTDGIGLNGGNKITAKDNIDNLNAQSDKIEAIIKEAKSYLSEQEPIGRLVELKNQYQEEYDAANEKFLGYLPEEYQDENEKSDEIEKDLIERLNEVNEAIENANNVTDAIQNTSNEVENRINEIKNSQEEPEPQPEPVTTFIVTLSIENGSAPESNQVVRVADGETASWAVYPNDNYKLPETVENGTISGNTVTSNEVHADMTVTVVCELIQSVPDPEPQPEPTVNHYLYIGATRPTAENIANEEFISGAIVYETEKPEWTVAENGTFTSGDDTSLWLFAPIDWGTVNIQNNGMNVPLSNMNDDTEEVYTNVMINDVEHIVRLFTVQPDVQYNIWLQLN